MVAELTAPEDVSQRVAGFGPGGRVLLTRSAFSGDIDADLLTPRWLAPDGRRSP